MLDWGGIAGWVCIILPLLSLADSILLVCTFSIVMLC
jgi:hypothetical protein